MKKHSITILYNSPVILTFALLSLLALGLGKLTDGWTTQNLFCVYRSSLTDWLTYPRFFLHVLGHPDFAAYCSNIVMLLVVGPTAEERFGCTAALLKQRSPSCGKGEIYDGTFTGTLTPGDGVTAALLSAHGVRVYGEDDVAELLNL